jgi:hypothetical protein
LVESEAVYDLQIPNPCHENKGDADDCQKEKSENAFADRFFNATFKLVAVELRQVLRVQKNFIRINRRIFFGSFTFEIIFQFVEHGGGALIRCRR